MADYSNIPLIQNTEGNQHRFELKLDDGVAFVEYMINAKGIIYLTHTEVPQSLAGKGIGSILVKKVIEFIKEEKMKMAPLCPFTAAYLKRHPDLARDLMAPGFRIG